MPAGSPSEVDRERRAAHRRTFPPEIGQLPLTEKEELLVRDLDMSMVQEMRDDWQFYRDRRPDSYTAIARA